EIQVGDVIQIGIETLIVQIYNESADRRIASPERFAEGLQRVCANGQATGSSFVIARLLVEGGLAAEACEEILVDSVSANDLVGAAAEGYEIMVCEAKLDVAMLVIQRAIDRLRRAGALLRYGVASYPRDGRDSMALRSVAQASATCNDSPRAEVSFVP